MILGVQKSRRSMHLSRIALSPPGASNEALEAATRAYQAASASEGGNALASGQRHACDVAFFSHSAHYDGSEEGGSSIPITAADLVSTLASAETSRTNPVVGGLLDQRSTAPAVQSISAPTSNVTAGSLEELIHLQPASARPSEERTASTRPSGDFADAQRDREGAQRNREKAEQQAWNDELADVRAETQCIKQGAVAAVAAGDIDIIVREATIAEDGNSDEEDSSEQWHEVTATAFIDPESGR